MKVSKEEAATACHEQAWVIEKEPEFVPVDGLIDDEQLYRKVVPASESLIHCFMGSFGADWNLESVLDTIEAATSIEWIDHLIGHNLKVVSGGKAYCFEVKPPVNASN